MSDPTARYTTRLATVAIISTGRSDHATELSPIYVLMAAEGVADVVVCAALAGKHNLADAVDIYRSVLGG